MTIDQDAETVRDGYLLGRGITQEQFDAALARILAVTQRMWEKDIDRIAELEAEVDNCPYKAEVERLRGELDKAQAFLHTNRWAEDLARLRRIEEAAREVDKASRRTPIPTGLRDSIHAFRAALEQK